MENQTAKASSDSGFTIRVFLAPFTVENPQRNMVRAREEKAFKNTKHEIMVH